MIPPDPRCQRDRRDVDARTNCSTTAGDRADPPKTPSRTKPHGAPRVPGRRPWSSRPAGGETLGDVVRWWGSDKEGKLRGTSTDGSGGLRASGSAGRGRGDGGGVWWWARARGCQKAGSHAGGARRAAGGKGETHGLF
jgi:hypothetical protein